MNRSPRLTRTEVAELLEVRPATVSDMLSAARRERRAGRDGPTLLPEPEYVGRTPLWPKTVIEKWQADRPGRTWKRTSKETAS